MPYISPAEREQAIWRTLPEAVTHVVRVAGCQPEDARRQISNALANSDLGPLRWEDARPFPKFSTGGLDMPRDEPPQRPWTKNEIAKIDFEDGTALDRSEFAPRRGRRRRLLIHPLRIAQWWPEPEGQSANQTRGQSDPGRPAKGMRGKPGPKPALRAGITEKMLTDLRSGRRTPEQLEGDTLAALVAEYGGSQNTAGNARDDALLQFSELQNSRQR